MKKLLISAMALSVFGSNASGKPPIAPKPQGRLVEGKFIKDQSINSHNSSVSRLSQAAESFATPQTNVVVNFPASGNGRQRIREGLRNAGTAVGNGFRTAGTAVGNGLRSAGSAVGKGLSTAKSYAIDLPVLKVQKYVQDVKNNRQDHRRMNQHLERNNPITTSTPSFGSRVSTSVSRAGTGVKNAFTTVKNKLTPRSRQYRQESTSPVFDASSSTQNVVSTNVPSRSIFKKAGDALSEAGTKIKNLFTKKKDKPTSEPFDLVTTQDAMPDRSSSTPVNNVIESSSLVTSVPIGGKDFVSPEVNASLKERFSERDQKRNSSELMDTSPDRNSSMMDTSGGF